MKLDLVLLLIYACFMKIERSVCTLLPRPTKIIAINNTNTTPTTPSGTLSTSSTIEFSPCRTAKRIYIQSGFQQNDIYEKQQSGEALKVCGKNATCCKPPAEIKLNILSLAQINSLTKPLLIHLTTKYGTTGAKFKSLFRSMIKRSHENLDTMFKRTYESRYQNNSYVFKSLYKSLHQYFNGSELNLQSSVDVFFEMLFEKIYVMSQPWVSFDKKYENCIFESTNFVKPFGDIQRKVAHQILRSFVASREFLLGLKAGIEVATKLLQLPVQDDCPRAFMRMTQCSVCSGVPRTVKPCKNYCVNVIKGCYVDTITVQEMWNQFIDAMVALTSKIEGPFSMEAVIEPLGVKISEAIMAFQENQGNITQRVIERCGTPSSRKLGANTRKRRATTGGTKQELGVAAIQNISKIFQEFKTDTKKIIMGVQSEKSHSTDVVSPGAGAGALPFLYKFNVNNQKAPSEFEKMLSETKASLVQLKDYWKKLSEHWCNENTTTTDDTNCWNGRNTSGYHHDVVKDWVENTYENPEVKVREKNKDLILDQASILSRNIKRVKSALNGNPPICVDCQGSGEGSGEGDEGSGDGGSGVSPTDSTGLGSGGGEKKKEKPTPTESGCANSVTGDCVETILPTTIDNNIIPFVPENSQMREQSKTGRSSVNAASCLLLLLSLCAAAAAIL